MIMEVLTGILVVVTGVYAYLTYKMSDMSERSVMIMKEQVEEMARPYLVVQPVVRSHTQFLYLRICNSGKTAALGVQLEIDKDFHQFDDFEKNLKDASAFSSRIDSFAPGQELFFALAQGWLIFGESKHSLPQQFVVTATYSYMGKQVVEKNFIDLRPFAQSEGKRNPIVEELEKIRKAHEKLARTV